MRAKLVQCAAGRGTTLAALINEAVHQYLDRETTKRIEKTTSEGEAQQVR